MTAIEQPPAMPMPIETQIAPDAIIDEQLASAHEAERTAYLQDLLGPDYEFAQNSGLLDMFYRDDATGEDGVMHVLGGVRLESEEGVPLALGYHHEPSAANDNTYVDRSYLEGANSKKLKQYAERRYEPYQGRTVIHGLEKAGNSTMFPKEYDALAVLQAVKQAYDGRETAKDTLKENGALLNEGEATMLDGTSKMQIRLVMNPVTKKVVSAFPVASRSNALNLGVRASNSTQEATKNTEAIHGHLGLN